MVLLSQKVYFYDGKEIHCGHVAKINKVHVTVLEKLPDNTYQTWRVSEKFLANNPELAKAVYEDYLQRLEEYKRILHFRRNMYNYIIGMEVIVQPFDKQPYQGTILKIDRNCLIVKTTEGKLMRVDKSICSPLSELHQIYSC